MNTVSASRPLPSASGEWLRSYYFLRATASIVWVVLAFVVGRANPAIAGALLVAYPAWDALANYLDAQRTGGLRSNPSQALNLVASTVVTIAVAVALGIGMNAVFVVFGIWAILSGLLQLVTAVRRWKSAGAQWVMMLSGAQSALAGGFFVLMAGATTPPDIAAIAGYAGFGAFYFLLSAIWLTVRLARPRPPVAS
jgi:uncharacterized membrane protein HdeD (DUF308 family)